MKRFFTNPKALVRHPMYAQVLVVWAAFAIMVITCYFYMSNNERGSLKQEAEEALSFAQAYIESELLEPETMMGSFTQTIRRMILRGDDAATVHDYMKEILEFTTSNERRLWGYGGAYGFFDTLNGGTYIDSLDRALPEGYVPEERPWYKAAILANGEVTYTLPYIGPSSHEAIITYTRQILDDEGRQMAVICLDLDISKISSFIVNTRLAEGGYGFALDSQMNLFAHPDQEDYVGKPLWETDGDIASLTDELKEENDISERIVTNYRGYKSILYIKHFDNGWYMGVVTPYDKYYQSVSNIAFILGVIGLIMALALSIILIRIIAENQKSEERIQVMFDATPLCINFWNKDYKNIGCNQESVRVFELSNKQEYLDKFYELSPEYQPDGTLSRDKVLHLVKTAFEEGYCRSEWMHQKLNGEPLPCEVILVRVKHRREYIVAAYNRDLRDYKAMLSEKRKAEIAEENNKAKSKFLAATSHEIRTPMNAILGITEIQLQNKSLPPDTQDALGKICDSGYLLLNIINDILDLSKIEAGKLELMLVRYDVASLINDTIHLNVMRFTGKPIEFHLQIDENIPSTLVGDELRVKQILNNLLSNAFKYTDSGEVSFSVAAEYGTPEQEKPPPVTLVFRVSDTGQGMTEEHINKLFTEYTRFNLEANRTTEGTGLGMNITKHLVRAMNGEISVESELGKGSAFTVRLPQENIGADPISREVAENLRQFRLGRTIQMEKAPQLVREYMPYGRVLIIDDVETNLYVVKGLLAPYGLSMETLTSGEEAVEKIKSGASYDIIFMDHFMPKMDGIEATKIIRSLGYNRPIVALTANALTGQAEMFQANGFDGFISKPIDLRQLNITLNKLIRDKYPPEVIEAARRQKNELKKHSTNSTAASTGPQLTQAFIRDAEKTIAILSAIHVNNYYRRKDDIQMFIINVHAMKSALANIGETELSAVALRLEEAGRERNIAVMTAETPAFLDSLQALIEKNRSDDDADSDVTDGMTDDDRTYLHEKLLAIQKAATAYDKKTAKDILIELKKKTWPHSVKDRLNIITEHLLHSEFDEVVAAVKNLF